MRIAVCLSGQLRTFDKAVVSIMSYFQGDYEVDFFCHTWDENTFRCNTVEFSQEPKTPIASETVANVLAKLKPIEFKVDTPDDLKFFTKDAPWTSLFYSMMMANHLKTKHENLNNFQYDCVVKCRYDLVFDPTKKFVVPHKYRKRALYFPIYTRMPEEHCQINADDMLFFGDSLSMNVASDYFRELMRLKKDDGSGPGTRINRYILQRNIEAIKYECSKVILRKEALHLNVNTDYKEITKIHLSYYK